MKRSLQTESVTPALLKNCFIKRSLRTGRDTLIFLKDYYEMKFPIQQCYTRFLRIISKKELSAHEVFTHCF